MQDFQIFETHLWNPLSIFGNTSPLLMLNAHTIIATWVALGVLALVLLFVRFFLRYKKGITRYLAISYVEQFKMLTKENFGSFIAHHFLFITSVFSFILLCNWIAIIPFIEEPTKDINTTLAMALIAFFYKEYYTIQAVGFKGYMAHFTEPLILMLPLNVIGHLSKVVSMAFRLFGNIFGGAIIMQLFQGAMNGHYLAALPKWLEVSLKNIGLAWLSMLMISFFVLFEGLIQAFVFAMLTMAYLAIAIQEEEH